MICNRDVSVFSDSHPCSGVELRPLLFTLLYFITVFYLFRHLISKRADLARLGGELGGKLRGQVHLTETFLIQCYILSKLFRL